jgi:hypothetical protein
MPGRNSGRLRGLSIFEFTEIQEFQFQFNARRMFKMAEQSFDFTVDKTNLYRDEYYTDLKIATIRRLIPVTPDGNEDKTRKTLYVGQANLMSEMGPVPISSLIDAKDFRQALKKYPETMKKAMEQLSEEMKKYQQEQQSSLVKPGGKEDSRIIVPGR